MITDKELVEHARQDLQHLRDTWGDSVADDELRRGSAVLRRLLVDGELQRAWLAAGRLREPCVHANGLAGGILGARHEIAFATPGGARVNGVVLDGQCLLARAMTPEELVKAPVLTVKQDQGLRAFVEGPGAVIEGEPISRRVIIKYVANALGGIHSKTKPGQGKERVEFERLDKVRTRLQLLGKPVIYFELLSYGQQLVASGDIVSFMEAPV